MDVSPHTMVAPGSLLRCLQLEASKVAEAEAGVKLAEADDSARRAEGEMASLRSRLVQADSSAKVRDTWGWFSAAFMCRPRSLFMAQGVLCPTSSVLVQPLLPALLCLPLRRRLGPAAPPSETAAAGGTTA